MLSPFRPLSSGTANVDTFHFQGLKDLEVFCANLKDFIPQSSQAQKQESIEKVLQSLAENKGSMTLEGPLDKIQSTAEGLQCLIEEFFIYSRDLFRSGDFAIHTTEIPSPCCKLPNEEARENLAMHFPDTAHWERINKRSASLDRLTSDLCAKVHIIYTLDGYISRREAEQTIFTHYWSSNTYNTCLSQIGRAHV